MLDKEQFLKKAEDVAKPWILRARGAATSPELASELRMTSRNRKKIPFFEITREEQRDDTKGLQGLLTTRDVLATYSDRARTGHNKSSSDKPATKSDRDWMEKCVGGSAPQSQCTPKNSGTYETAAAEEEKDTIRERPAVH